MVATASTPADSETASPVAFVALAMFTGREWHAETLVDRNWFAQTCRHSVKSYPIVSGAWSENFSSL